MTELRGTGRTQRMLEWCAEQARAGEYVIAFANSEDHVGLLYDRLMTFDGAEPTNRENGKVYFTGAGSVSFVDRHEHAADMRSGRSLGAHPSVCYAIDHYAVEEYIREQGWIITQLHRWDS